MASRVADDHVVSVSRNVHRVAVTYTHPSAAALRADLEAWTWVWSAITELAGTDSVLLTWIQARVA